MEISGTVALVLAYGLVTAALGGYVLRLRRQQRLQQRPARAPRDKRE